MKFSSLHSSEITDNINDLSNNDKLLKYGYYTMDFKNHMVQGTAINIHNNQICRTELFKLPDEPCTIEIEVIGQASDLEDDTIFHDFGYSFGKSKSYADVCLTHRHDIYHVTSGNKHTWQYYQSHIDEGDKYICITVLEAKLVTTEVEGGETTTSVKTIPLTPEDWASSSAQVLVTIKLDSFSNLNYLLDKNNDFITKDAIKLQDENEEVVSYYPIIKQRKTRNIACYDFSKASYFYTSKAQFTNNFIVENLDNGIRFTCIKQPSISYSSVIYVSYEIPIEDKYDKILSLSCDINFIPIEREDLEETPLPGNPAFSVRYKKDGSWDNLFGVPYNSDNNYKNARCCSLETATTKGYFALSLEYRLNGINNYLPGDVVEFLNPQLEVNNNNTEFIPPVENYLTNNFYYETLEKRLENSKYIVNNFNFVNGIINAGIVANHTQNNYMMVEEFTKVQAGDFIKYDLLADFGYVISIYYYNRNTVSSYDHASSLITISPGNSVYTVFDEDWYIRMRVAKRSYAELSDTERELLRNAIHVYSNSHTYISNQLMNLSEGANIDESQITDTLINKYYLPALFKQDLEELKSFQGTKFTFAVQTDTHLALEDVTRTDETVVAANFNDNSILPLKNLTNFMNFDFICNLGDIIRGYQYDTPSKMREVYTEVLNRYIDRVACPVLFAIGNHDDNVLYTSSSEYGGTQSLNELINGDELYGRLIKSTINSSHGRTIHNGYSNYYYIDYEKIRVIVLNTTDRNYSTFNFDINTHNISQTQLDWFTNIALNTNKQVLVMCHSPLIADSESGIGTAVVNNAYVIQAIKDFMTNGGIFIGCFYGHLHEQAACKVDGINHIVFKNGASYAELVFIDTENRTIETKIVSAISHSLQNRSFTY